MTRIKIRDGRHSNYLMVGNEAIDAELLDSYAGWLYTVLCRFANIQDDSCFPSLNTLMKKTKMSKPKLIECIRYLEELKFISVERSNDQKTPNVYTLLPLTHLVNDVNQPSKPDLLDLVNDVYTNNTQDNKTIESLRSLEWFKLKHKAQFVRIPIYVQTLPPDIQTEKTGRGRFAATLGDAYFETLTAEFMLAWLLFDAHPRYKEGSETEQARYQASHARARAAIKKIKETAGDFWDKLSASFVLHWYQSLNPKFIPKEPNKILESLTAYQMRFERPAPTSPAQDDDERPNYDDDTQYADSRYRENIEE